MAGLISPILSVPSVLAGALSIPIPMSAFATLKAASSAVDSSSPCAILVFGISAGASAVTSAAGANVEVPSLPDRSGATSEVTAGVSTGVSGLTNTAVLDPEPSMAGAISSHSSSISSGL